MNFKHFWYIMHRPQLSLDSGQKCTQLSKRNFSNSTKKRAFWCTSNKRHHFVKTPKSIRCSKDLRFPADMINHLLKSFTKLKLHNRYYLFTIFQSDTLDCTAAHRNLTRFILRQYRNGSQSTLVNPNQIINL